MKLSDFAHNKYSQFGEDGVIEKIFSIIGTTSRICVEFGAWDGFYLSNTANLWTNGWQGILIEGDKNKYKELLQNTAKYGCKCILEYVSPTGPNTLESILHREAIDEAIDLLSIDIDGDDYHIFDSLKVLRPRVIVCEFNPTIPADMDLVPSIGNYFGCSAGSLVKLARNKGYELVAMTEANGFFVQRDEYEKFEAFDTSLDALKQTKDLNYLISGFDGAYVAARKPIFGCTTPSTQEFTGDFYRIPSLPARRVILNALMRRLRITK